MDMSTLLYLKQITHKVQLQGTGHSSQHSVKTFWLPAGEDEGKG